MFVTFIIHSHTFIDIYVPMIHFVWFLSMIMIDWDPGDDYLESIRAKCSGSCFEIEIFSAQKLSSIFVMLNISDNLFSPHSGSLN